MLVEHDRKISFAASRLFPGLSWRTSQTRPLNSGWAFLFAKQGIHWWWWNLLATGQPSTSRNPQGNISELVLFWLSFGLPRYLPCFLSKFDQVLASRTGDDRVRDWVFHESVCIEHRPWKMMVGRWVSFWDCLFLGAMLNFLGVYLTWSVTQGHRSSGWDAITPVLGGNDAIPNASICQLVHGHSCYRGSCRQGDCLGVGVTVSLPLDPKTNVLGPKV